MTIGLVNPSRLTELRTEADELLRIIVASAKTARASQRTSIANRKSQIPHESYS